MVFLLIGNVCADGGPRRSADGEGGISFLPVEAGAFRLPDPVRRGFFQLPHEVGEASGRFQGDEKVNVIRHAADSLGVCVQAIDDAAKIGVEFVPPFLVEDGFAVFRREDEMVMQAGMGGGHAETGLAPLPGCGVRGDLVPVVSPAGAGSTTGYRMGCLRHRRRRFGSFC